MNEKRDGSWLDEVKLREACRGSSSTKEVLLKLGVPVNRGRRQTLKSRAADFGVLLPRGSGSHGRGYLPRRSDEDWFVDGVSRNNTNSKNRPLKQGMPDICAICAIPADWNGMPLTLQIDHIDGDSSNNARLNLRLVCPNCHSQTPTFSNGRKTRIYSSCRWCGAQNSRNAESCKKCQINALHASNKLKKSTKIDWPELREMEDLLRDCGSYRQLGLKLGVSDNAIRKHLHALGVSPTVFASLASARYRARESKETQLSKPLSSPSKGHP